MPTSKGGGTPSRWVREVNGAGVWKSLLSGPTDPSLRTKAIESLVRGFSSAQTPGGPKSFTGRLSMYASDGTGEDLLIAAALASRLPKRGSIVLLVLSSSVLCRLGPPPRITPGTVAVPFLVDRHCDWERSTEALARKDAERLVDLLVPTQGSAVVEVTTFTGGDLESFGRHLDEFGAVRSGGNGHWLFA